MVLRSSFNRGTLSVLAQFQFVLKGHAFTACGKTRCFSPRVFPRSCFSGRRARPDFVFPGLCFALRAHPPRRLTRFAAADAAGVAGSTPPLPVGTSIPPAAVRETWSAAFPPRVGSSQILAPLVFVSSDSAETLDRPAPRPAVSSANVCWSPRTRPHAAPPAAPVTRR